jgi:integrase
MGVKAARDAACAFDPKAASQRAEAGSFKEISESWIKRYVDERKLRSRPEIVRQLECYVYPRWATEKFFDIGRSTVNALLDQIVDKHGAPQADRVLAVLRTMMNWYATRNENYNSPIVKGMRRDARPARERARARVLSDDEIRDLWKATENGNSFGGIIRLLLLTAQRREKVVTMKWDDIADGVWTIATEAREKGNAGALKLPPVALKIIESQPMIDTNPYVFAGSERGRRWRKSEMKLEPPIFSSWSQRKEELDAKLPKSMPHWTLHDLRRTARSLMARAGVADNVAERTLGHAIAGVEGVYNRFEYSDEKADALSRLATLIDRIVNPPKGNVLPMPQARRRRR